MQQRQQEDKRDFVLNDPAHNLEADDAAHWASDCPLQIDVSVVDVLSDYTVRGVLVGFTPGEVAVWVDEEIPPGRAVSVHLNEFSFEGQTLYCGSKEGQHEVHISIDDMAGARMRRTPRFPMTVPAELMQPNAGPVEITIRDISRDGMGIESPVSLETGHPVAVVSGQAFVFAVVRYCEPLPGGKFRAGVEMHHLFEPPKPAESEPAPSNTVREVVGRWFWRKPELQARRQTA